MSTVVETKTKGYERITTFLKDLERCPVKSLPARSVESFGCTMQATTFKNWDGMGITITTIKNNTGRASRSIKEKDGLDGNVHTFDVEGFN